MVVVAESDPLKSLLISLGSNFQNLAKNFEHCFNGVLKSEASNFGDRRKGNVQLSTKHLHFEVALPFPVDGKSSYCFSDSGVRMEVGERVVGETKPKKLNGGEGKDFPLEHLMRFLCDQLSHFPKFDAFAQDHERMDELKALTGISKGERAGRGGFFLDLRFARVRGEECSSNDRVDQNELLRTQCFKFVSLKELVELPPPIGRFSKEDHNEKELFSVQDFFRYSEAEGMSSISTSSFT